MVGLHHSGFRSGRFKIFFGKSIEIYKTNKNKKIPKHILKVVILGVTTWVNKLALRVCLKNLYA